MFVRRLRRHQRGDTIVEVLLAIAILGLVLGTCYGIATLNQKSARAYQERSEALQFAQTQVERLKEYSMRGDGYSNAIFDGDFCLSEYADPVPVSDVGCEQDRYMASIRRAGDSGVDARTFSITISWDSIINNAPDKISLAYRTIE